MLIIVFLLQNSIFSIIFRIEIQFDIFEVGIVDGMVLVLDTGKMPADVALVGIEIIDSLFLFILRFRAHDPSK